MKWLHLGRLGLGKIAGAVRKRRAPVSLLFNPNRYQTIDLRWRLQRNGNIGRLPGINVNVDRRGVPVACDVQARSYLVVARRNVVEFESAIASNNDVLQTAAEQRDICSA